MMRVTIPDTAPELERLIATLTGLEQSYRGPLPVNTMAERTHRDARLRETQQGLKDAQAKLAVLTLAERMAAGCACGAPATCAPTVNGRAVPICAACYQAETL